MADKRHSLTQAIEIQERAVKVQQQIYDELRAEEQTAREREARELIDTPPRYRTLVAASWTGVYPSQDDPQAVWLMRFISPPVAQLTDRLIPGRRYRVIIEELTEDE